MKMSSFGIVGALAGLVVLNIALGLAFGWPLNWFAAGFAAHQLMGCAADCWEKS